MSMVVHPRPLKLVLSLSHGGNTGSNPVGDANQTRKKEPKASESVIDISHSMPAVRQGPPESQNEISPGCGGYRSASPSSRSGSWTGRGRQCLRHLIPAFAKNPLRRFVTRPQTGRSFRPIRFGLNGARSFIAADWMEAHEYCVLVRTPPKTRT